MCVADGLKAYREDILASQDEAYQDMARESMEIQHFEQEVSQDTSTLYIIATYGHHNLSLTAICLKKKHRRTTSLVVWSMPQIPAHHMLEEFLVRRKEKGTSHDTARRRRRDEDIRRGVEEHTRKARGSTLVESYVEREKEDETHEQSEDY
ncbi:hypothetical protein F4604DRAFT_1676722 [Suillus subluteus]|nr:hypothetical protein F4604DRAFT_1676722 [Suillus subluteus]